MSGTNEADTPDVGVADTLEVGPAEPGEVNSTDTKRAGELAYWSQRVADEGKLLNRWFESFYTEHFGLTRDNYTDMRVLDIGCGPRGSLEWASMARQRVGVDPLADDYLQMGAAEHAMTYMAAGAESIPFDDHSFDIVCSFNSLDHVNDLKAAIAEMKRLTAVGGLLLVLTDVHDEPTPQEPICFGWDVVELFQPEFALQSLRCCEKHGNGAYSSASQSIFFDHSDPRSRYGVLSARFMRVEVTEVDDAASETASGMVGRKNLRTVVTERVEQVRSSARCLLTKVRQYPTRNQSRSDS